MRLGSRAIVLRRAQTAGAACLLALCVASTSRAEAGRLSDAARRVGSAVGRAVSRAAGRQSVLFSARLDRGMDRATTALRDKSPSAARLVTVGREKLRPWSPLALAEFATRRVKRSPGLLGTYLAFRVPLDAARYVAAPFLPLSIASTVLAVTSVPLDLAFVLGAEHLARRRAAPEGEAPSLGATVRALKADYLRFVAWRVRRIDRAQRWALAPPHHP